MPNNEKYTLEPKSVRAFSKAGEVYQYYPNISVQQLALSSALYRSKT